MTSNTGSTRGLRRLLVCGCIALVVASSLVGGAVTLATVGAAQSTPGAPAEPAVIIALDDDGSARFTMVVTFDLGTEDEREAFESLRANATAHEHRIQRFASRMRAIVDHAEVDAGRRMRIGHPTIDFADRDATGIVSLSVTWEGLAARTGDELVLREPFASGFSLDRSFHVVAPEGYRFATATPSPTERTGTEATWAAGESLDGFEASFVPSPAQTATETTQAGPVTNADAPGYGIGVAITAVLVTTVLVLHRARNRR